MARKRKRTRRDRDRSLDALPQALRGKVRNAHPHHHHAPDPVEVRGALLNGELDIAETPLGERMRFSSHKVLAQNELTVKIERDGEAEILVLVRSHDTDTIYLSGVAPDEPHEFRLSLSQAR